MDKETLRALPPKLLVMVLIPMGDTVGKALPATLGATPVFVAWSRFALGALLVVPFVWRLVDPRRFLDWRIWLRALALVGRSPCPSPRSRPSRSPMSSAPSLSSPSCRGPCPCGCCMNRSRSCGSA